MLCLPKNSRIDLDGLAGERHNADTPISCQVFDTTVEVHALAAESARAHRTEQKGELRVCERELFTIVNDVSDCVRWLSAIVIDGILTLSKISHCCDGGYCRDDIR